MHELLGHPAVGPSFESLVVETLIDAGGDGFGAHHYRTSTGDEVDLVLVAGGRPRIAIEAKRSTAPTVSAGFHRACADLGVAERYVVHPGTGDSPFPLGGVTAIGLPEMVRVLRELASTGCPVTADGMPVARIGARQLRGADFS